MTKSSVIASSIVASLTIGMTGCGGGSNDIPSFDDYNKPSETIVTQSDLTISTARLLDANGVAIDAINKYEAGETLRVELRVSNIGTEAVPVLDEYVYCTTLKDYTNCSKTSATALQIQLEPNESKTFIFDTDITVENIDDNTNFGLSINIGEDKIDEPEVNLYRPSAYENDIFKELKSDNNGMNGLKIYVHQTDIRVVSAHIGIDNGTQFSERSLDNPIAISQDNVEGKYVGFCYVIQNIGAHRFYDNRFHDAIVYNSGAFGDGLEPLISPSFDLASNETSDRVCNYIELPVNNLTEGVYTLEANVNYSGDTNSHNNSSNTRYQIVR